MPSFFYSIGKYLCGRIKIIYIAILIMTLTTSQTDFQSWCTGLTPAIMSVFAFLQTHYKTNILDHGHSEYDDIEY